MNLEIAVETAGQWQVLNLRGRIDAASANAFDKSLRALIASGASRILINCADLRYVSSVGIGMIVECSKLATASGSCMSFAGINPHVKNVFEMVGFVELFEMYPSVEEALRK